MQLFKKFTFDSAHFLPYVPEGHKCKAVHGHTYQLTIFLEGELDDHLGWLMDFAEIKKVVNPIVDLVDHKLINDIEGLENPTCEIFAIWFWDKIKPHIPILKRVDLYENQTSGVIYEGANRKM